MLHSAQNLKLDLQFLHNLYDEFSLWHFQWDGKRFSPSDAPYIKVHKAQMTFHWAKWVKYSKKTERDIHGDIALAYVLVSSTLNYLKDIATIITRILSFSLTMNWKKKSKQRKLQWTMLMLTQFKAVIILWLTFAIPQCDIIQRKSTIIMY